MVDKTLLEKQRKAKEAAIHSFDRMKRAEVVRFSRGKGDKPHSYVGQDNLRTDYESKLYDLLVIADNNRKNGQKEGIGFLDLAAGALESARRKLADYELHLSRVLGVNGREPITDEIMAGVQRDIDKLYEQGPATDQLTEKKLRALLEAQIMYQNVPKFAEMIADRAYRIADRALKRDSPEYNTAQDALAVVQKLEATFKKEYLPRGKLRQPNTADAA